MEPSGIYIIVLNYIRARPCNPYLFTATNRLPTPVVYEIINTPKWSDCRDLSCELTVGEAVWPGVWIISHWPGLGTLMNTACHPPLPVCCQVTQPGDVTFTAGPSLIRERAMNSPHCQEVSCHVANWSSINWRTGQIVLQYYLLPLRIPRLRLWSKISYWQ